MTVVTTFPDALEALRDPNSWARYEGMINFRGVHFHKIAKYGRLANSAYTEQGLIDFVNEELD